MQELTVHQESSISLDFEMSFATQEDVFQVGEEVLTETFEKFAPEGFSCYTGSLSNHQLQAGYA